MGQAQKKVKKISPSYLKNLALWYLDRFGGTRMRVRQTLMKRVRAAEEEHGPTAQAQDWVEQVLDELTQVGLINDAEFARARVTKGLRQRKSRRLIAADLAKAGVDSGLAADALQAAYADSKVSDLEAARAYARKRKLGSCRSDPEPYRQKDLAAMARRGFSFEDARRALNLGEEDEA